jgi:phosphoribosylformimino-5-aminoimidazole carboxamide ribotide isomerase
LELIPAIDLIDGKCVRLYQGDYSQETVYADDPVQVALRWQNLGASRIHIVDLDGARSGNPDNLDVVQRIVNAVQVPVQMGGGVRTLDTAHRILDTGVHRVMLGTVAVREPQIVHDACAQFGSEAVVVAVDSKDGQVAVSGWTSASQIQATDLVASMIEAGVQTFLCTDISRDGTLAGPNYGLMRDLVKVAGEGVIAAGGIASIEHLEDLADTGVGAAVIGKALYTGNIDLADALITIEVTV